MSEKSKRYSVPVKLTYNGTAFLDATNQEDAMSKAKDISEWDNVEKGRLVAWEIIGNVETSD